MDKELLFKREATDETEDVPIGTVGMVTVRALSTGEVRKLKKLKLDKKLDDEAFENMLIAAALVNPVMTVDEVERWMGNAPAGDSVHVMGAVARLSGMDEGAQKSRVQGVRGQKRRP